MSPSYLAASVLLVLAVATSATAPMHEEPQDARITMARAHHKGTAGLSTMGVKVAASVPAEKKDGGVVASLLPLQGQEEKPSGGVATQGLGDGESSSGGGEHGKEEGSKEGDKAKSCLTKEECHKKRLLCGKRCTLSAHSKCAAKCSKSCLPTC